MAWYYDLVVLAILALCVWNGMRKGVSRSLLQTAATILSAVVALWVSQPLTMAFRFRENKYKVCWQTQRELLPSMDSIPGG